MSFCIPYILQNMDVITVEVALRIRPLVESEKHRGCKKCLTAHPDLKQVQILGTDKAFSYNYVFDEEVTQEHFYNTAVKQLVLQKLFKGYNVTILAYGQTGSGKTHSIGTNYNGNSEMGVIPRAVIDIFNKIDTMNDKHNFELSVSFMELYQENLYDLLAERSREDCVVDIREDIKGIKIVGLTESPVKSINDMMKCLIDGSARRATGATAMNAHSSRSHAVYTINIKMFEANNPDSGTTSKFHLVDLAGSERSKKTNATGERFKEGVNINRGLLALGNVISALGDGKEKTYINYRDSKLTRLLQDSLGGNSVTLMIACISPADYNLDETISTLRYADRARKIKNKPIVNQDPKMAEIARLNNIIQQLRLEHMGDPNISATPEEYAKLREENTKLQTKNRELNAALSSALSENTLMFERALLTQNANERLQKKLLELQENYNITLNNLNLTVEQNNDCPLNVKEHVAKLTDMQNLIVDLHSEHQRNQHEILQHECQARYSKPSSPQPDEHYEHQADLDERQELHTKEQLNLNLELQELNKMLVLKEQLASQIIANNNHMVDYAALTENESKIAALEKEKNELLQQLKNSNSNVTSKLAEQRRKRVKELETQLTELNKKVLGLTRMVKLKEKDDERIKQLNNEIITMKTAKVKLIKTLKAEEQKFRQWKLQREKEVIKLKDQDRKRQNEIVKMKNIHVKQQTVLKRKLEEAAAVNKRLKDALEMQKAAQERRGQFGGKTERIQQMINQQLDTMIRTIHNEKTIEHLLEDRALQNEQLENIRNNPNNHEISNIEEHIQQLTEVIEYRSAQIALHQQKIIDDDPENKLKSPGDMVQTMAEAKCALKHLFDLVAEIRHKAFMTEFKLEDLQNNHKEVLDKLSSCENKLICQSQKQKQEISEIEKEYEEKISVLLKQIRGIKVESQDDELKERIRIQNEELEKMEKKVEELSLYEEEVALLREKLLQINNYAKKANNKKQKKLVNLNETYTPHAPIEVQLDSSPEIVFDDDENDPDWRKTPVFKRIQCMKKKLEQADRLAVKRSSDGSVKCSCKSSCRTKMCGCRKLGDFCNSQCKCTNCRNLEGETTKKLFDDLSDSEDSFKRPRPLQDTTDGNIIHSRRAKRSYFGTIENI